MKKSKNLKTLDELELSARTRNWLQHKYCTLDEIIWHGRKAVFERSACSDETKKIPKALQELADVLDELGFIRHDLTLGMFAVGRLYHAIYPHLGHFTERSRKIDDFCIVTENDVQQINYRIGNERYENLPEVAEFDIEFCEIKAKAKERLTEQEYSIFKLLFGFTEDGKPHGYEEVSNLYAEDLNFTVKSRARIIRKLGCYRKLQPILEPVVTRAKITLSSRVEELQLDIRTYNGLKRAGLNTVKDVVCYPAGKWAKNVRLGRTSLEELANKLWKVGYLLGMPMEEGELMECVERMGDTFVRRIAEQYNRAKS